MSVRYIDEGDFRQLRPFDDHFLPQIPPSVLESVLLERNIQDNHRRKRLPFRLLGFSFDVQDTRADGLCLFYSLNVLTGMDVRSSIIEAFRNLPEHLRNTIMGYVSWRYSSLDLYIAHLNAPPGTPQKFAWASEVDMFVFTAIFRVRLYCICATKSNQRFNAVHLMTRPREDLSDCPAYFVYYHHYGDLRVNPAVRESRLNHYAILYPTMEEPAEGWDRFFVRSL
jgi:hypothetical protein